MLLFITYSVDHYEILHTSQQCNCHDVCILNQSTPNFNWFSNSIEIPLVERAPDLNVLTDVQEVKLHLNHVQHT